MKLSDNCHQEQVDDPAVVEGEDLGVRSGKWAAKVDEANKRIENGNACRDAERIMYSGEK